MESQGRTSAEGVVSPRYLLVDGHSVIFHWPELRKLHARNTAQAREILARQLEALHDAGSWRITLVFDGKGKSSPMVDPRRMVILYSQEGQTADSVIERIVGQQHDRSSILVVTADEAERQTIEALGAQAASPDWLLEELSVQSVAFKEVLKRVHRGAQW
ncbi:MAG: NYN domain-containing protein [bacterium]